MIKNAFTLWLNSKLVGVAVVTICAIFLSACTPKTQENQLAKQTEKTVSTGSDEVQLEFKDVWARATFAMAQTGAIYMNIQNNHGDDIRLDSVTISNEWAQEAQLHDMAMSDGMMQMLELTEGVVIAANDELSFQPGGKHIMLLGLHKPLNAGETISLQLNFDSIPSISIDVLVKDARNRE